MSDELNGNMAAEELNDTYSGGKAVQKWADSAMFSAEPIDATDGPRVHLLWMTPDPLAAIAAACKMYKGEVVRDLSEVTDEERVEYLEQVQKTKLQAPFEFVKFHFMIEGVTRAFTHQMVRQRTAVYAQESLRFAVKEDMPVGLPPSLAGTEGGRVTWEDRDYTDAERQREHWDNAVQVVGREYAKLVEMGMPAEDARGLLPHNTLTRLHYSTDLRSLLDHAGNRLCTQAQFEWRLVFARIAESIRNMDTHDQDPLVCNGSDSAYMTEKLSEIFRPVCYQTGKCEFKANFDRKCSIRERVDANAVINRPSSEWNEEEVLMGHVGDHGEYLETGRIAPIFPAEWLLNPGAAR